MARAKATKIKTVKAKKNTSFDSFKKSQEIWQAGSPNTWQSFAKQNSTINNRTLTFKGPSIVTNCINDHVDNNPSMHINPGKGFVKCFSCGYYESNAVRFWAAFSGRTPAEIAKEIQKTLDIKILSKGDLKDIEEDFQHSLVKKHLAQICNEELLAAKQAWESCGKDQEKFAKTPYYYCNHSIPFLEHRGVLDNAHFLPIGILPTAKRIKELASSRVHNGKLVFSGHEVIELLKYFQDYGADYYLGAVVMFYHSTPNDIARFRLRIPNETDTAKAIIAIKDAKEDRLGIFGLGMYSGLKEETSDTMGTTARCVVVEGEFDQMHYAMLAAEVGNTDIIVLSHSGGSNHDISDLANFGIKHVYYVPDCDAGGEKNAYSMMVNNHMFSFRIFRWPIGIQNQINGKTDLDDALKMYGFEPVHEALIDWKTNWVKPELWAREQVTQKIRAYGCEDDIAAASKIIFDYGQCIGDPKEEAQSLRVANWAQERLKDLGMSDRDAEKMTNDFISRESPEELFCARLTEKIGERFEFIAIEREPATIPVTIFDKKSHCLTKINTASTSHIKASLKVLLGDLAKWVKEEIGVPDFIKFFPNANSDRDPVGKSHLQQSHDIAEYFILAIVPFLPGLPERKNFTKYSAGNHWLPTEDGHALFCVNGKHVYECSFSGAGQAEWKELVSPIRYTYLFDTSFKPWSKYMTLDNLRKPQRFTLNERLQKTYDLLNTGWSFQSQHTECLGLAAHIVMTPFQKIFPQNMQFLAANERQTGKSSLYAEFIGGGKSTEINIVEHVKFVDNATPAGIRQAMDGSSLMLVIDEFDNQGGGRCRSEKMEEVMQILRTCSAGEGAHMQGTASGEARVFHLSFSAMIAGIDPSVSDANMTRFFTTDLKGGLDSKISPATSIFQKNTRADLENLKESITLDGYRDIPLILQSYKEIQKYVLDNAHVFGNTTLQRFKDNMMILMSAIKAGGMDWEKWCKDTCAAKGKAVANLSQRTAYDTLICAVLYTATVARSEFDQKRMTVAEFFVTAMNEPDREVLNASGSGVRIYEDEEAEKWYLLIVWQEAITGVLRGNTTVKTKDNIYSLQETASRHPQALSREASIEVFNRLTQVHSYVRSTAHTILDITSDVMKEHVQREAHLDKILKKSSGKSAIPVNVKPPETDLN
jgi:hypothetical protein